MWLSQTSASERPRVVCTAPMSGANENQDRNATKKLNQAKWKARMCGRRGGNAQNSRE